MAGLAPLLESQGVTLTLVATADAASAADPPPTVGFERVLLPPETALPWTLRVAGAGPAAPSESWPVRIAGLGLLLLVIATGSYFVARAVHRELAVARLQSDFVAAVSHEFRTPLTTLRQVTEILGDGRVTDRDRALGHYRTQMRATDRLRRLVETLLDFARMEAGARPYQLQPTELSGWIRGVVDDFRDEAAADGHAIELRTNGRPCRVDVDPEALAHAVRNLLDNAVKYSPGGGIVRVEVEHAAGACAIRVRDEGLGIPREEQPEIWRKFVRGSAPKAKGIKGTGVGLAMVRHIVEAHHGTVLLESRPGRGSTFTLLLPERRSHGS